jgi:exopolyphosphatase / guanosine-5'-triphosphate,3'-diphosphate pyrophosphatase
VSPVAAIDCGTNSTRLLVVDDTGRPLERLMRITRLGQGVDATGELRDDAIERTLDVLRDYRGVLDRLDVQAGRLAATSAARDASNGAAFLAAASSATGFAAELLTGEEEGRLSFAGATSDLDRPLEHATVVDIGGGSTELVVLVDGEVRAHSMQIGCVRLTERALPREPVTLDELDAAAAIVDAAIDGAFVALPELEARDPERLVVGLAGTVSTLAMVDLRLVDYDEAAVHHHWLSLDAIRRWCATLASDTLEARAERPGMVQGREDVIVAGAVILERVIDRLGTDGCLSSEHDILDGLAQSVLQAQR